MMYCDGVVLKIYLSLVITRGFELATTWIIFWAWIWPTRHWTGKNCFVDFNAGKTRLVSFDRSNNNGSIDVKMDGSVIEEK